MILRFGSLTLAISKTPSLYVKLIFSTFVLTGKIISNICLGSLKNPNMSNFWVLLGVMVKLPSTILYLKSSSNSEPYLNVTLSISLLVVILINMLFSGIVTVFISSSIVIVCLVSIVLFIDLYIYPLVA